jgi:uncharacterized membrane protein YtjA (UPF0391 family)
VQGTDAGSAAFVHPSAVVTWPIRLRMEVPMLYWAVIFFVIALIAALFGFGGIASASAGIAQILFFVFLVLLVISLVMHVVRGGRPPV